MKKQILPAAFALAVLASCSPESEPVMEIETNSYESIDQLVWTNSTVRNHIDEEGQFEERNLDTAFVSYIMNDLVNREGIEFLDYDDVPMSREQLNLVLKKIVPVFMEDPNNPGTFIEKMDTVAIDNNNIIEIFTREQWMFDKETVSMQKKVTHLAPVILTHDPEGNPRGKALLFWIKMN